MNLSVGEQLNVRQNGRLRRMRDGIVRKGRLTESLIDTVEEDIQKRFVEIAKQRSQEILAQNVGAAGARVDMDHLVDGSSRKPLGEVNPGGRISFFYNPIQAVVNDAMEMALRWAPIGKTPDSPKYVNSFIILQDVVRGQKEVSMVVPWPGKVDGVFVEIVNTQPYAGSLEPHTRAQRGPRTSRQAPNGIMELVAANLKATWGSVMKINLVSRQWPSIIEGKKPDYHLPTVTISPNWRGIGAAL